MSIPDPQADLGGSPGEPGPATSKEAPLSWTVLGCGLATTALTLLVDWFLQQRGVFVAGFYVNLVIPAGAVLLGLVAGLGYGIAAFLLHVRFTRKLVWTILALQLLAYFEAQYVQYRLLQFPITFWEWFDLTTQTFAFEDKNGQAGQPLGLWGYGIRALEIVGFCLAALISLAPLAKRAFCESCRRYMKTKHLALCPAGLLPARVKKAEQAAHQQRLSEALNAGLAQVVAALNLAKQGRLDEFKQQLAAWPLQSKETLKLSTRLRISAVYCPNCRQGLLAVDSQTIQGNQLAETRVLEVSVPVEYLQQIVG